MRVSARRAEAPDRPSSEPTMQGGSPNRRTGIVLGAGGVLGAAWTVGALRVLEETTGFDPRDADVLVGTSAGSVLSALIGLGVSTEQLAAHQRGSEIPEGPQIDYDHDGERALPPLPRLGRVGSGRLLAYSARHPLRVRPAAVFTSLLPAGRGSIGRVGKLVTKVSDAAREQGRDAGWPQQPSVWIVAMDYETGRRVPFGRPGSPPADLSDAVMASCAIPAWYAPVVIGGRRYVDGGVCSPTSLDLLAGAGLDHVYVLAPMAADGYDRPRSAAVRMERRVRHAMTRRLQREVEKVQATGTRVVTLAPGPEDLRAIGVNMMDARRRRRVFETSLETTAAALARRGLFDQRGELQSPRSLAG